MHKLLSQGAHMTQFHTANYPDHMISSISFASYPVIRFAKPYPGVNPHDISHIGLKLNAFPGPLVASLKNDTLILGLHEDILNGNRHKPSLEQYREALTQLINNLNTIITEEGYSAFPKAMMADMLNTIPNLPLPLALMADGNIGDMGATPETYRTI
jgi:hypothetical protein